MSRDQTQPGAWTTLATVNPASSTTSSSSPGRQSVSSGAVKLFRRSSDIDPPGSRNHTARLPPRLNAGAILIALLVMVIPGAGASLALHRPGQAGIPTRLALCFGLGYAAAALAGVLLEILHVLNAATYVGLLAAVTAVLWGHAIRRDGLRAHAAALRDELVAEPWLTGSGLAAM